MNHVPLRRLAQIASVIVTLYIGGFAYAADDQQTGPNGNPGVPGIAGNPPTAGGDGEDGGSANADAGAAVPNDDPDNTAAATGGNGGNGGSGGDATGTDQNGANGGNGGDGGDATAVAVTNGNGSFIFANATAIGGNGGNGGTGGHGSGSGSDGIAGNGGDGGNALVQASATDGNGFPQVFALAVGGDGGSGTNGGDGGSAGIIGTLTATSLTSFGPQAIYIQAQIRGGNGGDSTTGMGGAGADVTLSNGVAAFSSSTLYGVYLEQSVLGGSAGGSTDGGVAGIAGNASSSLTIDAAHGNQSGASNTDFTVQAFGGNGGSANTGTNGGSAFVSASITESHYVSLNLTSVGGNGGNGIAGNGGDGGIASLGLANATSTGSSLYDGVHIVAAVTGGNGGDSVSGNGGGGASVTLINAISASVVPTSGMTLIQQAIGGSGGATGGTGQAGIAGNADSELTMSQDAVGLQIAVAAGGGDGGGLALSVGGPIRTAQVGGHATAFVDATNSANEAIFAEADAGGGAGGFGVGAANGGDGGMAEAHATGKGGDNSFSQGVNAYATARGGVGGHADGTGTTPGSTSGGDGGIATASAFGISTGSLVVTAGVFGGFGGDGENGANGGHGADVNLVNPVNGLTPGRLELDVNATGGEGGNALDTGAAGLAGNANAALSLNQLSSAIQSNSLRAEVTVQGGLGGNASMQAGASGGSAHASTNLSGSGALGTEIVAIVRATGGDGGYSLSNWGGDGGAATATASVVNTAGNAIAAATAVGGSGGYGAVRGGDGASISLVNAVSGSSASLLDFGQDARGGNGGDSAEGGTGGRGGDAVSSLTVSNPDAGLLAASVTATGGNGGSSQDIDGNVVTSSPGGSAAAMLDITGAGGLVGATAAFGGMAGGPLFAIGPPSSGADATAVAKGTLTADAPNGMHISAMAYGGYGFPSLVGTPGDSGMALARATGTETFTRTDAPSSDVSASATSYGGFLSAVNASAFSSVYANTSTVEARSAVDRPVFPASLGNGLQAASYVTGLPSKSDVQALEKGHTNVQNAFSHDGTITVAVVNLSTKSNSTGTNAVGYFDASASFNFGDEVLETPQIEIGLLDGIATGGGGLQGLTFSIELAKVVVETDNFDTLAGAVEFFHDHVINVGEFIDDPKGGTSLSLTFHLTLQSTGSDGFSGQFIVGAVPEPSTYLLLGAGLGLLALQQFVRRRRRVDN